MIEEPGCGRSKNLCYLGQSDRWYCEATEMGRITLARVHAHTHTNMKWDEMIQREEASNSEL